MKRILLSLLALSLAGAGLFYGSQAYFSDVEESVGNTFAAGALDLQIDSQAHYAGLTCTPVIGDGELVTGYVWKEDDGVKTTRPDLIDDPCDGTWAATDLTTEKFFTLEDVKPGDEGENTISMRVIDNPAYMCVTIDNLVDKDNGQTEPELVVDTADDVGELSQEIRFFAWADNGLGTGEAGNNKWDVGEPKLFSNTEGPASDVLGGKVYPLYTPLNGAFPGDTTQYIGLYWCYGKLLVDETLNTLTCDGVGGTNLTQTDSMSADISFYVEQARNNENFVCPSLVETRVFNQWPAYENGEGNEGVYGTKVWEAEGRAGDIGADNPARTWEVGVGTNTQGATQDNNQSPDTDYDWVDNQATPFTLSYNAATGMAIFSVTGAPTQTYNVGAGVGAKLWVAVKANGTYTGDVENLMMNGNPLANLTSTGGAVNSLEVLGLNPSQDFTLTGNITFDYEVGAKNSDFVFKVEVSQ